MGNGWDEVVVAVTVVPERVNDDTDTAPPGSDTVKLPVAGVIGVRSVAGSGKVKCVLSTTEILKMPLNAVFCAPEMVTNWPLVSAGSGAVARVTVARLATSSRLIELTLIEGAVVPKSAAVISELLLAKRVEESASPELQLPVQV